ncbi:MAG: glycoside hydrolase family 3 N-terminal domain-containing protein [Propionicimonas sp.]|uniref:glycoside hydrolase family 3 protein n=1 Tax=Propionicimonas sp. TaxID=1955623 RepID=UPI003D0B16F8
MDDETLRRAVNATLMPGFEGPDLPGWLAAELAEGLGSVCLFSTNIVDAGQVRALTDAIHAANPAALVATDEEGGDVTRLHHAAGSPYPSMASLGHLDDEDMTERVGFGIGAELLAAGIDLNLAPDADVNSNPRNPVIGVRSFGADAGLVGRHVAAYTRGLQAAGTAACAKHFPGHGDTATDSHLALPTITVDAATLAARELVPFRAAVEAGTLAVMTSHILVPSIDPDLPATLSAPVLALLREDLGFTGAIVSDALDMAGASGGGRGIPEAAVLALAAGCDLLCIGTDNTAEQLAEIRAHVLAAVAEGRLPQTRLLDAAERVAALSAAVAALRDAPGSFLTRSSSGTVKPQDPRGEARHEGPPPLSASGFWLRGPVAPLTAPVFLRLASTANIAAGDTVWGVAEHLADELADRLPGSTCADAADLAGLASVLDASAGRPLVVQGRDLARVPFLVDATAMVLQRRPDALVVELGWPELPGAIDIATYGSGRGAATCLIRLLAEGSR